MTMLASLAQNAADRLITPLSFFFVLTIVVFVHELGHFLVARWCGVQVRTFSIGFGREIFGFNDRHGTRWRFAWIPLGGYVKFVDDDSVASTSSKATIGTLTEAERAGSFHAQPVAKRAAVVAAGPLINFLFSIIVFTVWFLVFGVHTSEPRIDDVSPNSPASRAGLQAGDVIKAIDGRAIAGFEDVQRFVATNVGKPLVLQIARADRTLELTVTPELREIKDETNGQVDTRVAIGIIRKQTPDNVHTHQPGVIEAVTLGLDQTRFIISSTLGYLHDVVTFRQRADQLKGIGGIADIAGKVARQSVFNLVQLTAFLSVSIGLINLFPIPVLDGGHLMYYAAEAIRGRPLSERTQEIGFRIGLAVIVLLMVFANANDLPTWKRWFSWNG